MTETLHEVSLETGEIVGEEFTEQQLVAMLGGLYQLGKEARANTKAYNSAKQPVGDWLQKHPGQELRDGETQTVARYKSGGFEELLDAATMAENAPDAVLELARRGLLRLDMPGFKRQEETFREGAVARRFIYKEPRTERLLIEKE